MPKPRRADAPTALTLPTDAVRSIPIIPREALLRLPEVMGITGLSETVIYARMGDGTFPRAKQVGPRTIAWSAARVFDWMEALPDWRPTGEPAVKRGRAV